MRSPASRAERVIAQLLGAALLTLALLAGGGATPANAAVKLPPPDFTKWPEDTFLNGEVCGAGGHIVGGGYIVNGDHRAFCDLRRACLEGSPSADLQPWCDVVGGVIGQLSCWELLSSGIAAGSCDLGTYGRKALTEKCRRPPPTGPDAWLCEQFALGVRTPATPPPATPPPTQTTPPPTQTIPPPTQTTPPPTQTTPPPTQTTPPPAETPAPSATGAEDEDPSEGAPDVFSSLGATSPFCQYPERLSPEGRDSCKRSGSIAHRYPISHYGLDINIGVDTGGLLDGSRPEGPIDTIRGSTDEMVSEVIQQIGNLGWMGGVYWIEGTSLLTQWALEVSLIGGCTSPASSTCTDAMPEIGPMLQNIHQNVVGTEWMMLAFAVAGLWGMWNGLVRHRFTETFGGLVATIALMGAGLAILNNPAATVGQVAKVSNDAALGVLNSVTRFAADNPTRTFDSAQQGMFDSLVRAPWCALQFGDVKWCTELHGDQKVSIADLWLSFEAGSPNREALYKLVIDEEAGGFGDYAKAFAKDLGKWFLNGPSGPEDELEWDKTKTTAAAQEVLKEVLKKPAPEKVRLQEQGGTPTRIAMLFVVALTMFPAGLVLGWGGVRLFMASGSLLLHLAALPAALLAPAFGPAGRDAAVTFGTSMTAAVLAKLIFSFVVAVLIWCYLLIVSLSLPWFAGWILAAAYWWGVFSQRRRLRAIMRLDPARAAVPGPGDGLGLMKAYFAYRGIKDVGQDVAHGVSAPFRAIRAGAALRGEAEQGAVKQSLMRELGDRARGAAGMEQGENSRRALRLQRRRDTLRQQMSDTAAQRKALENKTGQPPQALRDKMADAKDKVGRLMRQRDGAAVRAQTEKRKLEGLDEKARIAWDAYDEADKLGRPDAGRLESRYLEVAAARDNANDMLHDAEADKARADAELPTAESELAAARRDVADWKRDPADEAQLQRLRDREDFLRGEDQRVDREMRSIGDALRAPSAQDIARRIDSRRAAIDQGHAPDAPEQLRWAGIDPGAYATASPAQQAAWYAQSQSAMEEDRRRFEAADADVMPEDQRRAWADHQRARDPHFDADVRRGVDEREAKVRRDRRWRWFR